MATERLDVILQLITGNYKREAREAATATSQIGAAAGTSSGQMGLLGQQTTAAGNKLRGMATGALVAAGVGIIKLGADSVRAASDLEESLNAVNVVFGTAAGTIIAFGEDAAEAAGLAQSEFQQMASVLGSALINAGIPLDEAAAKTIELTQRAADMASVFNTSVPDALGAMQSALRGETDPIEKFGVTLTAASVDAEAAALGFKKVSGEFDAQAKAAARLSLIMKQTDRVAGDFANTSDGLANSGKILSARFTDLKAKLGEVLVPAVEDAIKALEPLLDALGFLAERYTAIKDQGEEMAGSQNVVISGWGRMIGEIDVLDVLLGNYTESIDAAIAPLEGMAKATDKVVESSNEVHDSWDAAALAEQALLDRIGPTITMLNNQYASHRNVAAAADTQRRAMINLADAQADLLDPIANVLRLQKDLAAAQEHLTEVQEDGESTASDLALAAIEAEQAFLRLQSAGAALTPDQVQAFALVLINDLGMSEQQALDTLAALNLLDGWTGTATFTLEMNTVASGGGGVNPLNDVFAFDTGGVVPGPRGSQQLILAHGGETILPTHKSGASVGGTTIYVQSPMNEFRSDLQYATILASVTNLVEAL